MQSVQLEVNLHNREANRLNHEHTESMREWNKLKSQLRKIKKELGKAWQDINSLQEDEIHTSNFDTDISEFEQLVNEEQTTVDKLKDHEVTLVEKNETARTWNRGAEGKTLRNKGKEWKGATGYEDGGGRPCKLHPAPVAAPGQA